MYKARKDKFLAKNDSAEENYILALLTDETTLQVNTSFALSLGSLAEADNMGLMRSGRL